MKIAIPIWEDRVSPVLDTASRLLIVEGGSQINARHFQVNLLEEDILQRCLFIYRLEIDVLICGAVSRQVSELLILSGVKVIPGISGLIGDVLEAYFHKSLSESRFIMPGYKKSQLLKDLYWGREENQYTLRGWKEMVSMMKREIYPKIDINNYRKETQLKDGTKILLRPMVPEDQEALYEFFKSVSEEEARYLRDDVKSRLVVEKWAKNLDYTKTLPILAVNDHAIIADATINRRRFGWKWHLGTIRIFVHNDYRNLDLGKLMVDELSLIAYKLGIEKLIIEIPDVNTSTIDTFDKAGFYRAAVISNMVKDRKNMPVDVVVMMKDIKPAHDDAYDYDF